MTLQLLASLPFQKMQQCLLKEIYHQTALGNCFSSKSSVGIISTFILCLSQHYVYHFPKWLVISGQLGSNFLFLASSIFCKCFLLNRKLLADIYSSTLKATLKVTFLLSQSNSITESQINVHCTGTIAYFFHNLEIFTFAESCVDLDILSTNFRYVMPSKILTKAVNSFDIQLSIYFTNFIFITVVALFQILPSCGTDEARPDHCRSRGTFTISNFLTFHFLLIKLKLFFI